MTAREPDRLPRGCENWQEWREKYSEYRTEFVTEKMDRIRYKALLGLLGFTPLDIEKEISEAFNERRKFRLHNGE